MRAKLETVDEYIAGFPKDIQKILKQMRATIKKAAPGSEEVMSYNMPGYKLNGMLTWFAGCANHTGFYPKPSAIVKFKKELSKYKGAKGSVQFSYDEPLPLELITKMIQFRVNENLQKIKAKKK